MEYTGQLARFTEWLAYATGVIALIGLFQWWQLKRTVDLSREEFISTYRPRIVVRRISINVVEGKGVQNTIAVEYVVANVGNSAAKIVQRSARLWFPTVTEDLPSNPPYADSDEPDITLEPGDSPPFKYYGEPDMVMKYTIYAQQTKNAGTDSGGLALLFLGYIVYEDPLKRKRRTAFLRRCNLLTGRFTPINEPNYEYQEPGRDPQSLQLSRA